MKKKEIINTLNSDNNNDVKDAVKFILNNDISMMDVIINAITPGFFGKEVVLSILIESTRKNEWLFPLILKLLYNEPIYLNSLLGYAFFEVIQRALASVYYNDETCNSLLVNFICDKKIPQAVRSIGLDCLSLVHVNDMIDDVTFKRIMNTIYQNMDDEIVTDFAIISCDNGLKFDLEDYYKKGIINQDIYPYMMYQQELKVPYFEKKKEMLKKKFFNPTIDIFDYIDNYLKK